MLSRRVGNCSSRTLEIYATNLHRFQRSTGIPVLEAVTPLAIQQYLAGLQERLKPVSIHQHYRCLRTFFAWCVEADLLRAHPMRGLTMKVAKTLPVVPEDDAVRRLLAACSDTFEGRRNRALVALLADSGLRISEALHLRIEDMNFTARTIQVRGGKGGKDGVGFFGAEAAQCIWAWLARRPDARLEDFLFCDRQGRGLARSHGTHILHRLSARAGLP